MIALVEAERGLPRWHIFVDQELVLTVRKCAFTKAHFQEALFRCDHSLPEVIRLLAKRYALSLLARKAYSSSALSKKMATSGFTDEAIHHVILGLQEQGYIDDQALLERQVKKMTEEGRSPQEIRFRLKQEKNRTSLLLDEKELLYNCLKKKYRRWQSLVKEPISKGKLIRSLLRRGFSLETIRECLRNE